MPKRHKDIHLQVDLSHFGYPWLDNEKEDSEERDRISGIPKIGRILVVNKEESQNTVLCILDL